MREFLWKKGAKLLRRNESGLQRNLFFESAQNGSGKAGFIGYYNLMEKQVAYVREVID